ncbi:MASE3 domain-containing sensor histidine kinase [Clostridium pasteurianum]|uniref:histidine kinase n=1 Tax=Clostridium pasteurianum BC1 TaxID=86416 RepID=R4K8B3_CLOPA|nr:ATP-binding protein [Clostridium pasteurianum]AGK98798.1 PAS domain S-box [Clostridium pasteurianum BC1]
MEKIHKIKFNSNMVKEIKLEIIAILVFFVILILLSKNDISSFNIIVDIISAVVALNIFITSVSTSKYLKHNLIILAGISYGFIGIINLLYVITYRGLVSPGLDSLGLLKNFEFIRECVQVISAILIIFVAIKNRKDYNKNIFNMMIISSIFIVISQFIYNFYGNAYESIYIISKFVEIIGFYLIYKVIINFSIRKPYNELFSKLNNLNSELEKKNVELQNINDKLKKENFKRKATSLILKETIQRYRTVLSLTPNLIIITKNNKCIFANKAALSLFKLKNTKEIMGKNILNFVHKDYQQIVKKRMETIKVNGGECPFIEEKYIAADGSMFFVKATAASVPYDSELAITIARDITESKRAEENEKLLEKVLQSDRIRKDFFANISHELRTPLNVIFTSVQLLDMNFKKLNITDKNLNKYLNMTKQNCYRLLKLINNLIDITKIDSGYLNISLQNCDIVEIIEDTVMSIAEYIKSKDIEIIFDTEIEEKYLACDEEKISRVIINLLSNAVKFTKPGGRITVNVYDKGNKILISVKDTGIGIPTEMKDSIFERFIQAKESLAKECGGSGIGLSIVKALVEMHKGDVWVESEEGKGSEFFIEIPVILLDKKQISKNHDLVNDKKNIVNIEFSDIMN